MCMVGIQLVLTAKSSSSNRKQFKFNILRQKLHICVTVTLAVTRFALGSADYDYDE